ncbi:MAG: GNAT family N-acetyltransferase [Blastomonas sp.]
MQADRDNRLGRTGQPSLFDRLDWAEHLHRLCLPDRKPALYSASANEAGHPGTAWLFLMGNGPMRLAAFANWYNFSFRPVFHNGITETHKLALLAQIARKVSRKAHRVTLSPLPDEDQSASLVERAFWQAGWVVYRRVCDQNHILSVRNRTFDEYWQSRPGQLRSTVRRKSKNSDVALRIETQFSDGAWKDYESVYAKSWKPEEGNPDFLKHLAQQEGKAGCLRLGLAYVEGKAVAAQFWTVENGVALIHKLAHDESAIKASPGTLLSAALFQHVIDQDKVRQIDFGTGNDRYKSDWMEEVRDRYELDMFWPHNPLSWPYIARNWLGELVARHRNR